MAFEELKSLVTQNVRTNGTESITGAIMQRVLLQMIDELGAWVGGGISPFATQDWVTLQLTGYATTQALASTNQAVGTKQAQLVSGQNIKTINGESILGSGNMEIGGGGGGDYLPLTGGTLTGNLVISENHNLNIKYLEDIGQSHINEWNSYFYKDRISFGYHGYGQEESQPLEVVYVPNLSGYSQLNIGGKLQAVGFTVPYGTEDMFLKADGSVDTRTFLPLSGGTVQGRVDFQQQGPTGESWYASRIDYNGIWSGGFISSNLGFKKVGSDNNHVLLAGGGVANWYGDQLVVVADGYSGSAVGDAIVEFFENPPYVNRVLTNHTGDIVSWSSPQNEYGNVASLKMLIDSNKNPWIRLKSDADEDGDHDEINISPSGIGFWSGDLLRAEIYSNGIFRFSEIRDIDTNEFIFVSTITDFFNNKDAKKYGFGQGVCTTAAATAEKTVNLNGFVLVPNGMVSVRFTNAINVPNATLNVGGTGAKPIMINGNALQYGVVLAGMTAIMQYDGTNWNIVSLMGDERGGVPQYAVDLGLPSGTLWADRNVDVTQKDGFALGMIATGSYFSWGNIDGHNAENGAFAYNWGTSNDGPYASTKGASVTSNLSPQMDCVRAHCGAPWRLPTKDDFQELYNNCTWNWTTQSGVTGYLIESNVNYHTIFLPAAGYGYGTSLDNLGSSGNYWSSSFLSSAYAYILYFNSGGIDPQNYSYRFYGFSVRAVQ